MEPKSSIEPTCEKQKVTTPDGGNKDLLNVMVIGQPGKGKSTFLNFMSEGKSDEKSKFRAKSGIRSTTLEVASEQIQLWGTDLNLTVYDTPGFFSQDLPVEKAFEKVVNGAPSKIHALLWIYSLKDRVSELDTCLFEGMDASLNDFRPENLIVVFTHCDLLEDESVMKEAEKEFQSLVNENSQRKAFKLVNRIFFGIRETTFYKHTYNKDLETILRSIQVSNKSTSFRFGIKMKEFASAIYSSLTSKAQKNIEKKTGKKNCYDGNSEVYIWSGKSQRLFPSTMKDVKIGDKILTVERSDEHSSFRFAIEPVLIISRYPRPMIPYWFIKITVEDSIQVHKLKIHRNHYVNICRNGEHHCILAGDVVLGDILYACPIGTLEGTIVTEEKIAFSFTKAYVKQVELCLPHEMGEPINIRTPSRNLLVDGLWCTSRFHNDVGLVGHGLICLASKVHPQGGQILFEGVQFMVQGLNP